MMTRNLRLAEARKNQDAWNQVHEESCRTCGNAKCAADKCVIADLRIMLECGKALDSMKPVHEENHWIPREDGGPDEQELEKLKAQADAEREAEEKAHQQEGADQDG